MVAEADADCRPKNPEEGKKTGGGDSVPSSPSRRHPAFLVCSTYIFPQGQEREALCMTYVAPFSPHRWWENASREGGYGDVSVDINTWTIEED